MAGQHDPVPTNDEDAADYTDGAAWATDPTPEDAHATEVGQSLPHSSTPTEHPFRR